MITERDLEEAIAECQGERNPNANTCIKLAAYYTIRRELFRQDDAPPAAYSYAPAPTISYDGESEFAKAIHERDQGEIWPIMDELMNTLQVLQPRLYNGVMRKIQPGLLP